MASSLVSSLEESHGVYHERFPRWPRRSAWALLAGASACLGQVDYVGKTCGAQGQCPAGLSCSVANICEHDATLRGLMGSGGQGNASPSGSAPPEGSRPRSSEAGAAGASGAAGGGSEALPPPPLAAGAGAPQGDADAVPGAAGVEATAPLTVAGHVIDFFRRPVPGIPVSIAQTTVETNEAGEFRFEGVSSPYDIALLSEQPGDYADAWVYQGLTRADPTLQVFFGLPQRSSGDFSISTNLALTSTQSLGLGAAGPDGAWSYTDSASAFSTTGIGWRGPSQTSFTFHALQWENSDTGPPSGYLAHDVQSARLQEGAAGEVVFDLAPDDIANAAIAGTVTGGANIARYNYAYLRFADQAQIELFYAFASEPAFEYAVPALAETSIVIAATDGYFESEYALAHREVAAGERNIQLEIPQPARLRAPESEVTGVGPGTVFEWEGNAGAYLLSIEDVSMRRRSLRVLTSSKSVALPALPYFALTPGAEHQWRVETHGRGRNVDDLAGPGGFADAFSSPAGGSGGPRSSEGSYSISAARGFIPD